MKNRYLDEVYNARSKVIYEHHLESKDNKLAILVESDFPRVPSTS